MADIVKANPKTVAYDCMKLMDCLRSRDVDPLVLSRFCGQPGAAATVGAGLQPGELSASGGVAPVGASLDIDDVAGEIDQDWGEGRAPFPADHLPAVARGLFRTILSAINRLRLPAVASG